MLDQIITVPTDTGDHVTVLVDEPLEGRAHAEVVLGAVFGATAQSMFQFAYALAANGFRVLRVDFRDHVGLSEGVIEDMRLSTMAADLAAVLGARPGALLAAVSLSARPALRVLADGAPAAGAVLVTPVVDVRSTLALVIGQDHLAVPDADVPALVEVLGYPVRGEFVRDCRAAGMVGLDDALADVARIAVPVAFVAGDADPWVAHSDVATAADAHGERVPAGSLVTIPAAAHRLNRNPAVAARYVEATAAQCLRLSGNPRPVVVPTFDAALREMAQTRTARAVQQADRAPAVP